MGRSKGMRTINQQDYIKFIDFIVMRFGIPLVLILNNGPQLVGSDFQAYLKELGIKHKRSYVAHPQGIEQVEVTSRTILRALEKRLEESKKTWFRGNPFKLAYGSEARLPVETGSPSHKVINFDEVSNFEGLKTNPEPLDEVRDREVQRMEKYKEKTKLYF
ncbi:uncharacterized protein LOC141685455 [Apium graveolens]|uniref:uncharacterized protein LOC141685455 n=1 Tax=Apium graveolens TaxID=4045 RepID=UPI003D79AC3C